MRIESPVRVVSVVRMSVWRADDDVLNASVSHCTLSFSPVVSCSLCGADWIASVIGTEEAVVLPLMRRRNERMNDDFDLESPIYWSFGGGWM